MFQFRFARMSFFDQGDGGGDDSSNDSNNNSEADSEDAKFAKWLAAQPADLRAQFETHTSGLLSALKKERKNASEVPQLKSKLSKFEAEEQARLEATRTKEENLTNSLGQSQSRVATLEAENKQLRITSAVEREASKLRFIDPTEALLLLPKDAITVDEQGNVSGVVESLTQLATAKPHLLVKEEKKGDNLGSKTKQDVKSADQQEAKPVTRQSAARL